jgi:single-strand DNA-binding protein
MNKLTIIGRLYKDVELRKTKNGKDVAELFIVYKNGFKNEKNEYESTFITSMVFGPMALNCSKYLKKGSQIACDISIKNNNYTDKNDIKHYDYAFYADNITFVSFEKNNDNESEEKDNVKPQEEYNGIVGSDEIEITDADLPF